MQSPLSPLELPYLQWPATTVCWVFDYQLDALKMRRALDAALEHMPWAGGTLSAADDGRPVFDVSSRLSAKDLLVQRTHEEHVSEEALRDSNVLHALLGPPKSGMLFSATVVNLRSSHSLLGVAASHALMDACSLMQFMECWSRCYCGTTATVTFDRPDMIVPSAPFVASLEEKIARGEAAGYFLAETSDALIACVSARKKSLVFELRREAIEAYKSAAGGGGAVTANDALVAHIWRLQMHCSRAEKSECRKFTMLVPMNLRTRGAAIGLSETSFGCCIANVPVTCTLPENGVVPSLHELATLIHAAVASFDVSAAVGFAGLWSSDLQLRQLCLSVPIGGLSCITSWRRFGVLPSAQFPDVAKDFRFPSAAEASERGINWLGVVLPFGDGIRVHLNVPATLETSDWDFCNPDASRYSTRLI